MKLTDRIKTLKLSGPLGLILLFFVSSVIIVLFVNFHERHEARQFAESKAMPLLDRNLATHFYFSQDLKPFLFDLLDEQISSDYFDPLWMSSTYAIQKIDGEPYLEFLRRGEIVEQSCLRCHSDTESAPQQLIARYGKDLGFGRKPGEYSSAISIRIPLSEAYAATTFHSVILSLFFVVLLLFVMAGQFIFVRERKRAQSELDKRGSLLKQIMESTSDIVFLKDTQGRYLDINKKALSIIGKDIEAVRGKDDSELFSPDMAEELMRNDRYVLSTGETRTFEETMPGDGGEITWLTTKSPCRDADGNIVGVLGVTHDITERKRAEEERGKLLKAIGTARDGMSIVSPEGVMTYTNMAMDELFGYDRGELVGKNVEILNAGPAPEATADEIMSTLVKKGSWEGEVWNKRKDGSEFLTYAAVSATVDSEGTILYFANIQRDITARKRAEAEIVNLAKFPSENPNPVLRISNEGVILYANEASEDVLETWDRKAGEKLPAKYYKRIEASVESGGASEFEFECSNGRIFSATLSPVADEGYVNVYGLDITERKETEEALRESEELHRITIESISDAVFMTDDNGDFTFICPNVNVIFGYSYAETESLGNISKLLGDGLFDIEALKIAGEVVNIERDIRDKRGNNHSLLINVKHVSIKNGTILYNCRDISDRKAAAEALRGSEERFRRAVTEAPFPIMIHAEDGEVLQINKVWTELTGYEPKEIPTISAWTQRAYGERKDVVKSRIDKLFEYDSKVDEGEYVITSRNGKALTWDFSSAPLGRLPDGRRLVISMAMDVTDRKETEEEIESLARFPAESPNPVLRIRRDGMILYSNRVGLALENAWGCHQDQRLKGQWLEMVEKALNLGAVQGGEIEYQGRVFSLVFAPVVESDYVNIYGLDITDLHEAETALHWESSVNKALANLSNILNKPYFSFEEISDFVLAHAKRLTGSKFGVAGYIDEQTGYLVCPTMTKEVWKKCRIQGKDIVFKEFNGLWGWVLNERKSVLVNSPADDPRASGTPQGHVPIERFIGVPSLAGDEVIGMLAIANADRDYAERDLWLIEQLAETYALAIQSNRSQRRLEKHQGQLRDLVSSLGLAHERSARKLATGLHTEIIDRLNSTSQSMASEGKAPGVDPMPGVREALSDLVETTHAFASGLSCPVLRQSGLAAAVENWLTEDIRKKHGIETVFEKDDTRSVFDEDMGHFLFEAIKELLANTVEHARATRVKVLLKRDGDDVRVAVADDGIGFDMAGIGPKTGEGTRYNLFCIGERLRHLGGDMEVDSAPGKGTTVVLKTPAKAMSG